jgi:Carboxypeptidase regulatory-like domain
MNAMRIGWVWALVGVWLWASAASAQPATSTLLVRVTDSTGAPLAGVTVSVTHVATSVVRTATTTLSGTAAVPLLPSGDYHLTARVAGFRVSSVERLHVDAGSTQSLGIALQPGSIDEIIVVTAERLNPRTSGGAVAEIFDGQQLTMTPMASRDVHEFAWQAPGAAPPAPGSRLSGEGGTAVNVAGARETSNNFLLDGTDNNDLFLNRVLVTPSLDAVQTFTLLTNTYDAQYGRNAGAQVNVVLKSGGDRVTGSIYEYFRDRALEARGPLDPPGEAEPFRRRHQAGGTVGGPIRALASFYFLSIEGTRNRTADTRVAAVPTLAERAGDFRTLASPIVDPLTGLPFPGNRIPASRIDPVGARLAGLYPAPNRSGETGNFVSSPVRPEDSGQLTIKTDHRLPGGRNLFTRYSFARNVLEDPFPTASRNVPGFGTTTRDSTHNLAAGMTETFGRHVFNDLRVGWNRLDRQSYPANRGVDGFAALGMIGPVLDATDVGYPAIVVTGFDTVGDDVSLPVVRQTGTVHVTDTVSIERGSHLVKTGVEIRHYGSDGFNHLYSRGEVDFQGAYTGNAVADLLLGLPTFSLAAANDNAQALRTTSVNAFVQDDWRVHDRLTINAGLRYERNTAPVDAFDRMAVFDAATATVRQVGQDGVPRAGITTAGVNLGPRVGASWVVSPRHQLLLRAGYGIFYDGGTLIENSALYFNPPYFALRVYAPGAESLTAGNPFAAAAGFVPPASVNTLANGWRTASARQASVGLEGRRGRTDLTVRWVGAWGGHLVRKRNLNQPMPGPGAVDDRRPIAGYGDILLVEPEASSVYHALQVRAERPTTHGLWLRAAWTWGKSIDDQSAFLASDGNDNTPQNSRAPELERGLSDFDVRHRLVAAALWQVPALGRSIWGRDWQVSVLFSAQSGRPFTPRMSADNSNTGNLGGQFGYDRPNEVPVGTPASVTYGDRAFQVAPPYTFGNAGRNILIGPSFASIDAAVMRTVRLRGTHRLELRAEIYNVLDRANFGLPASFVDRATFGQSLTAGSGRLAQLAARWAF